MESLANKKLCKWHNLNNNKIKKFRKIDINEKDKKLFLKNLSIIGYSVTEKLRSNIKKISL